MELEEKSRSVAAGPCGVRTPDTSHVGIGKSFPNVYEAAEDTFLLLDALQQDVSFLLQLQPTIVLEMGSGSGCVIAFLRRLLRSEQQQRQQKRHSSTSLPHEVENLCEQQKNQGAAPAPSCSSSTSGAGHHSVGSPSLLDRSNTKIAAAAPPCIAAIPPAAPAVVAAPPVAAAAGPGASRVAAQTAGDVGADAAAAPVNQRHAVAESLAAAGTAAPSGCLQKASKAALPYLPVFVAVDLNWEAAAATVETARREQVDESAAASASDSNSNCSRHSGSSSNGSSSSRNSSSTSSGKNSGSCRLREISNSSSSTDKSSRHSHRSQRSSSGSGENSGSSSSSSGSSSSSSRECSNNSSSGRRLRPALPGVIDVLAADLFTCFRCQRTCNKPVVGRNSSNSSDEKEETRSLADMQGKERTACLKNAQTGAALAEGSSTSRADDDTPPSRAAAAALQKTQQRPEQRETAVSQQQQQHSLRVVPAVYAQQQQQRDTGFSIFDVILFNPPYVPGEQHEERPPSAADWAWWGGRDGREVTDRFLAEAPAYLSPRGALYLVLEKRNRVDEVVTCMKGRNFLADCILQRKIHGGEHLSVWRFTRNLP